jgi:hypothetical protein
VNRVATMGQLTASIAHEVKQPLAAAAADGKAGLNWLARSAPEIGEAMSGCDYGGIEPLSYRLRSFNLIRAETNHKMAGQPHTTRPRAGQRAPAPSRKCANENGLRTRIHNPNCWGEGPASRRNRSDSDIGRLSLGTLNALAPQQQLSQSTYLLFKAI